MYFRWSPDFVLFEKKTNGSDCSDNTHNSCCWYPTELAEQYMAQLPKYPGYDKAFDTKIMRPLKISEDSA